MRQAIAFAQGRREAVFLLALKAQAEKLGDGSDWH
jgi:hypothetical protein